MWGAWPALTPSSWTVAQAWAQNFVSQLLRTDEATPQRATHAAPLPAHELLAAYRNSSRRLLMLCLGGSSADGNTPSTLFF